MIKLDIGWFVDVTLLKCAFDLDCHRCLFASLLAAQAQASIEMERPRTYVLFACYEGNDGNEVMNEDPLRPNGKGERYLHGAQETDGDIFASSPSNYICLEDNEIFFKLLICK